MLRVGEYHLGIYVLYLQVGFVFELESGLFRYAVACLDVQLLALSDGDEVDLFLVKCASIHLVAPTQELDGHGFRSAESPEAR